ncbi:MAG: RHS repeat-associated core domain-containing protein, partial [Actinomycetia bacterium]|nr:RHS repeat-associated core domain-containing protein [Actinomycetes bacterium]
SKVRASGSAAEPVAALAKSSFLEQVPLVPGWNLVSLPEEPGDSDPAAVLSAIGGYAQVSAYDACDPSDPWKLYDPNDPMASDLAAIDHRIGLWIEATSAVDLPSDGTLPATTTFELCTGWNLIGFPAGQPRHVRSVLHPIEGKVVRVFGYDASTPDQLWQGFDVQAPYWANNLDYMLPGRGYMVLVTEDVTLEVANQGPEPTVAISAPQDLAVVTELTAVVGEVASDLLSSWALSYRLIGEAEWIEIESRPYPVAGGELGILDPTLLLNGLYEVRVEATDLEGRVVEETIALSVEGQMKIGHFTLSFVDLAVPVSGLDIEVVRSYDSRDLRQGDFGVGWTLDIRQGSYRNNRPPGDGWEFQTGFLPCDTVVETRSHLTVVRLSDQEVYRFAMRLADGQVTGGGCFGTARFEFVDGPMVGATLGIVGNNSVFFANDSDRVVDADTLEVYEPEDVRLTTRDGRIFDLDLVEGVTRLEDLNGNRLTITPAGITHSSGKAITFERDAEGRIERIVDPRGNDLLYGYDAAGDLRTVTNQAEHVTRFEYDDAHRIVDIFDSREVRAVRTDYDADGRLVSVTDALGNPIELHHDLEANQEIVTNRLGLVKVLTYDSRGNVIEEIDEAGKRTLRTYDAKDRLLSETDPNENTTTHVYDPDGNLLSVEDPLGNKTEYGDYDALGNPWTITDPRGKVTTNTFDGRGNLLTTTDPLDHVTTFTYDSKGQLATETDADQKVTTFSYDGFGNQTGVIDALGHETTSTYDASGNLLTQSTTRTFADGTIETLVTTFTVDELGRTVQTLLPDGSSTETTYDLLGAVIATRDALERETTFEYDDAGRQTRTNYPDSTFEERTYDLEGRMLTVRNRAGKVTSFEYDPVGRLKKTLFPGGAFTESVYDDAGRLMTSIDARGQATVYGYDKAGRRTTVTNALENVTTFRYDAAGNQVEVEDPLQRITGFEYDDAGRLVKTLLPDGESTATEYDALGHRVAEVDQALVRTEFSYDALGRLVQVKDALEGVTTYGYDEVGNRISQTDANQHTTRFEYDAVGRQTKRILPGGSFESFTYDAAGNRRTRTDFNGITTTYEYDVNGRLSRRSYPDGSAVSFTYTATGRRSTVTDARGVTSYFYDDRDRLLEKKDPTGHKLTYAYDAQGNRSSLTATVGAGIYPTTYTYDALNRLETVTDSQGGITTLGYDANGNRASLAFPNSVTTSYSYDTLNRLTNLTTINDVGDVLQSYAYTLDLTGNRVRIDEHDGTSRHYQYDALYRLTQDRVTDSADALVYRRDFTYDPVGNRLAQTIDEGGESAIAASVYDTRDRLLSVDSTDYTWDANGNLASSADGGENTYGWDHENRLTTVVLDDGTFVETTYDVDGNRVRTAVTPPGGSTAAVDYLVDTSGFLSHVVADVVDGSVETLYTRANEQLISLHRPASGIQLYYHVDGLGSTRALSDNTGSITDRYAYSAFGELMEHWGSDTQPYQFAGQPNDPKIGFAYHRARWMGASLGRFLSVDPFLGVGRQPRTLHHYIYALNNPALATDPTGQFYTVADGIGALSLIGLAALLPIGATAGPIRTRPLTQGERNLVESVFYGSIRMSTVRISNKRHNWFQRKSDVVTLDEVIHFPRNYILYSPDFSKEGIRHKVLFIHEMAHIWQIQRHGNLITRRAKNPSYIYLPTAHQKFWEDFGIEQQAQIVQHYYMLSQGRLDYAVQLESDLQRRPVSRADFPPLSWYIFTIPWLDSR